MIRRDALRCVAVLACSAAVVAAACLTPVPALGRWLHYQVTGTPPLTTPVVYVGAVIPAAPAIPGYLPPAPVVSAAAIPAAGSPAAATSPAIRYDQAGNVYPVAACTAAGGTTVESLDGAPLCSQVPYLGSDGQVYYTSVPIGGGGRLDGPAGTEGTGATRAECEAGRYPDGGGGPPGRWSPVLALCQPDGGA